MSTAPTQFAPAPLDGNIDDIAKESLDQNFRYLQASILQLIQRGDEQDAEIAALKRKVGLS